MEHTFFPGNQWLYIKIYCGKSFANKLIIKSFPNIFIDALNNKLITKYFFIRYEDPEFHLRLRVELVKKAYFSKIIQIINETFEKYIEQGFIWNIQLEPYKREINRYGIRNIELIENIFFHDTQLICKALPLTFENEKKLIIFAMLAMDQAFNDFTLSFLQKKEFTTKFLSGLQSEFELGTIQKKKINSYYKKTIYDEFIKLSSGQQDINICTILKERSLAFCQSIKSLDNSNSQIMENIYFGINHLFCNRLFSHRQRIYEMICYDMLLKYYKSTLYSKH